MLSMVFIYEEVCGVPIPPKTMLIGFATRLVPGVVPITSWGFMCAKHGVWSV